VVHRLLKQRSQILQNQDGRLFSERVMQLNKAIMEARERQYQQVGHMFESLTAFFPEIHAGSVTLPAFYSSYFFVHRCVDVVKGAQGQETKFPD
jgi:hypothetical protein